MPTPDTRVQGDAAGRGRSEKTGFAQRDIAEWDDYRWTDDQGEHVIPAGRGVVVEPNDGGFVWIENEGAAPILPWEVVRLVKRAD